MTLIRSSFDAPEFNSAEHVIQALRYVADGLVDADLDTRSATVEAWLHELAAPTALRRPTG